MTTKTLVCVHAHPDDEALFTAGLSAHYAAAGYRVVLITCTDGQLGIDQAGRPGAHPDHDDEWTRTTRARELDDAAALVGFSTVHRLGYDDSGMVGWSQNSAPNAFCAQDPDVVAARLAAMLVELDATVVVTYDETGFYGHPDHVMANDVVRRAVALTPSIDRLFYCVVPASVLDAFERDAASDNLSLPAWVTAAGRHVRDEDVDVTLDVSAFAAAKQAAIAAHASQIDNADLVTMDARLFAWLFGTEYYRCVVQRDGALLSSSDLFGGL